MEEKEEVRCETQNDLIMEDEEPSQAGPDPRSEGTEADASHNGMEGVESSQDPSASVRRSQRKAQKPLIYRDGVEASA